MRPKRIIRDFTLAVCLGLAAVAVQTAAGSTAGYAPPGGLPPFPPRWDGHLPGVSPVGASRGTTAGAVSKCSNSNAEVEQAVDGSYVYEAWIGCSGGPSGAIGIGFARSTDGGRTFGPSMVVPGSVPFGFYGQSFDPAVAVGPDGTVYVSYMVYSIVTNTSGTYVWKMSPAVAVSVDHGATFPQVSILPVPPISNPPIDNRSHGNWGDRAFIAVASDGTVYVTWDYGPRADQVRFLCAPTGSCAYANGDFNAVIQKSTDGGLTWTMPGAISPGFPLGGAYSAPIVVEPNGTLGVLYLGHPTDPMTLAVGNGTEYFTSSTDGGTTWSIPVAVDPGAGTIALPTWWIDGALAVDSHGTLYASWDTQNDSSDIGWLAWSTDGGQTWSAPIQVAFGSGENLLEVAAAGPDSVYVGWQTPNTSRGYATFLRRFSISTGWTTPAVQISPHYGDPGIWPGDTFGLSTVQGANGDEIGPAAILSWGSAINDNSVSEIYSSVRTLAPHP